MLTITISARAIALLLAATSILIGLAFFASTASGGVPTQVVLGDINCDGLVNGEDALGALRYTAGLSVDQEEPCFEPASVAAIPGPPGPGGPPGPQGLQGEPGDPAVSLYANVDFLGNLLGGTALSAERTATGRYEVTFAPHITGCAAVVTPGATGEGGGVPPLAIAKAHVGPNSSLGLTSKQVAVHSDTSFNNTPDAQSTDFHLLVVC